MTTAEHGGEWGGRRDKPELIQTAAEHAMKLQDPNFDQSNIWSQRTCITY